MHALKFKTRISSVGGKAMKEVLNKMAEFIDQIHDFFDKTDDEIERANRQQIFDSLLNLATYSSEKVFEDALSSSLPLEEGNLALQHICQQLREINGLCTCSFSDKHEIYQSLFANIPFDNFESKASLRNALSKELTELIFEKTNTETSPRIRF